MSLSWKLAWAYAWRHPTRMLLTSLAMIASACMVVWVVSGYDAVMSQMHGTATEYLGRYDLFVIPDSLDEPRVPGEVADALRKDATIAELEPVMQIPVRVQSENPPAMSGPPGGGQGEPGGPGMAKGGPDAVSGMRGGPGMSKGAPRGPRAAKGGQSAGPGMPKGGPGGGPGAQKAGPSGPPRGMFMGSQVLVGTNAGESPYPLKEGVWIERDDPKRREAVISNVLADQLQVQVNDNVLVILGTKEYRLKIVGIAGQIASQPMSERAVGTKPSAMQRAATIGPASSALYVPMALAEKIARQGGQVNLVNIKLKEDADHDAFRRHWTEELSQIKPPVALIGVSDIKNAMEEGRMADSVRKQAWAATGMSLLAALFIIFTTLSMGVSERVRQFAVLRAVGLTRGQVGRVIAAESIVLALIGWGGGLLAGWILLQVASNAKPGVFANGGSLGAWCVLLTGVSAFGGALAAAVIPAWQATSVQPLEAMSPRRSTRPSMRLALILALIGLVLVAVNPLLVYMVSIPNEMVYGIYEAVGCSSMAVGFLLLAPLAIVLTEIVFVPLIARVVGLDSRLLASQLSSNLWRTLGTTAALTVGLGLYVAMMVWGYSMLQPFKPGEWVPDLLAAFQLGGLPDNEIQAIRQVKGVIAEQCIPLAVDQPRLVGDITHSEARNSVTQQDNVIIIGLDPEVAFGGQHPLIGAEFVAGSRDDAIAKLKSGRNCIVPDHFLAATGLKIGDRFGMIPPEATDKPVEYTIVGAVSLPGWHWMTKFSGLRRRSGRSAAMVFAPYEDVRRDFQIKQLNFFWMNIDKSVGVTEVGNAMQAIADRNVGERQPVNGQGSWVFGATMFGTSLRISTPEDVRTRITNRADDMIWAMCQIPLITLFVTSLGVINTIMASVRSRRWELGVMRALGVTQSALFRMILVEGLLIGLVACLLSVAFGVMAGWCGAGISQYVSFFGGLATPLYIPWAKLALGLSATIGLCLLAALWPAFSTCRTEPLTLLQEGRSST